MRPRKPNVIKFTVNYDPSQLQAGAPLDGATLAGKHIHFAQQPAPGKLDVIISPKKQNTTVDDGQILQIPFTIVGAPVDGITPTVVNVSLTNVEMSDGSTVTLGDINDGTVTILWLDTDGDGTPDYADKFPNNRNEQIDTDNDGIGNNFDTDDDNDGMPDVWENFYKLVSTNPADATLDPDNDGLTNLEEYRRKTDPHNSDTDDDYAPDGFEVAYGADPAVADSAFDVWTHTVNTGEWNGAYRTFLEDVNGDGRADLVQISTAGGTGWISLAKPDGSFNIWDLTFPTGELNGLYRPHFADVNGDGRVDLIQFGITGGNKGSGWVGLAGPDGNFQIWTHTINTGEWDGAYQQFFEDVNGDGRADLVQISTAGGTGWISLAKPDGSFHIWDLTFPTGEYNGLYRPHFADVNGDGRVDLIQFGITGGNKGSGWVGLAGPDGNFQIWTHTINTGEWDGAYRHFFADVNGDGRADLVQISIRGGTGWISLAKPDGSFHIWDLTFPTGELNGLYRPHFSDVNGDGRVDLIQFGITGVNKCKGWVGIAGVDGNFDIWTREIPTGECDGWYRPLLGDVTGNGKADLVQIGRTGDNAGKSWVGLEYDWP